MNLQWDQQKLDLHNLLEISRGRDSMIERYLRQFQDLIPSRLEHLQTCLEIGDRKMIRQIIHKMGPQLQFFGIPNVLTPITRLEQEYETMPAQDLEQLMEDLLSKLNDAGIEVNRILEECFPLS